MDDIQNTIQQKLSEIERTHGVRVIFACESGSRAWGFASADSDYDVRFVYARRVGDYLRLEKTRDVIEYELNEVYDINGWDIQKLLRLLAKSNPVIFEWTDSPIVYRTSAEWERVRAILSDFASEKRLLYHYLSMAKNNIRSYFKADSVILKKYLYVLRPILACEWVLEKHSPPPTMFSALCDAVLPAELADSVSHLLEVKKNASEKATGAHIQPLDDFIFAQIAKVEEIVRAMPNERTADWGKLDAVFAEIVGLRAN